VDISWIHNLYSFYHISFNSTLPLHFIQHCKITKRIGGEKHRQRENWVGNVKFLITETYNVNGKVVPVIKLSTML
jgi:hypothetical protein